MKINGSNLTFQARNCAALDLAGAERYAVRGALRGVMVPSAAARVGTSRRDVPTEYTFTNRTNKKCQKSAFTLVEIALCLAIIGFALVAIIGVLPAGMRVQKDNREETIINQDGSYLLEAIRSGSRGIDDLTNYVEAIIITNRILRSNGQVVKTTIRSFTNDPSVVPARRFSNGSNIVSLLTTPKLRLLNDGTIESNSVVAFVRSITGVAAEKSVSNPNVRDFAFRYMLRSEVIPFTQPPVGANDVLRSVDLANNLHDVRLTLNWPLFQRGGRWEVGSNRKTFRTLVAGGINPTNNLMEPYTYQSRY